MQLVHPRPSVPPDPGDNVPVKLNNGLQNNDVNPDLPDLPNPDDVLRAERPLPRQHPLDLLTVAPDPLENHRLPLVRAPQAPMGSLGSHRKLPQPRERPQIPSLTDDPDRMAKPRPVEVARRIPQIAVIGESNLTQRAIDVRRLLDRAPAAVENDVDLDGEQILEEPVHPPSLMPRSQPVTASIVEKTYISV
ncbi:hypothetical protein ACQPZJ_22740 [Actinoplanes sp. CA-054009]